MSSIKNKNKETKMANALHGLKGTVALFFLVRSSHLILSAHRFFFPRGRGLYFYVCTCAARNNNRFFLESSNVYRHFLRFAQLAAFSFSCILIGRIRFETRVVDIVACAQRDVRMLERHKCTLYIDSPNFTIEP